MLLPVYMVNREANGINSSLVRGKLSKSARKMIFLPRGRLCLLRLRGKKSKVKTPSTSFKPRYGKIGGFKGLKILEVTRKE